jgi:uncharacterized protein YlxW (UPF0749 family)
MKILSGFLVCCVFGVAVCATAAEPSKESARDEQAVVALTKELETQQATIADNQTKIDAKLATIAEALRLAKIYSARGR